MLICVENILMKLINFPITSIGRYLLAGLVLTLATDFATAASMVGDTTPKMGSQALIADLKKGGYVIYFRHAATGNMGEKDVALESIADCTIQRNLTRAGIEQSEAIGAAFKSNGIPVGEVFSSPYCRCMDTATNMFGRAKKSEHLFFAINVTREKRAEITGQLKQMLATQPKPGTNTALVSHTANLREATTIWPKPEGVAHVFRPLDGNTFSYVGVIYPDEWAGLSNQ